METTTKTRTHNSSSHIEYRRHIAKGLAQLADKDGLILSTLPDLKRYLKKSVNETQLNNWKKYGLIDNFEVGNQIRSRNVLIECSQDNILSYIQGQEVVSQKDVQTETILVKEDGKVLKSINEMTFTQKIRTIFNLVKKMFFK